ncbi:MAG: hypothetical protein LBE67_11580 [Kocuria palustris]|jgi:hypothetical protein|nr:hypothetical protein [Kocuria palustris]
MLVFAASRYSRRRTYEVENASGGGLILSALGEEEQTLAGLAGPSRGGVGNSGLLVLVEDGELLALNSLLVEVEEALGKTEAPEKSKE